jgi:hypothetical protein
MDAGKNSTGAEANLMRVTWRLDWVTRIALLLIGVAALVASIGFVSQKPIPTSGTASENRSYTVVGVPTSVDYPIKNDQSDDGPPQYEVIKGQIVKVN